MFKILQISQIVLSALVILFILLQQRGSSLGSAFGGGSTAFRSRRGIEKFLFNATIVVATLFVLVSLAVVFWDK
jgi:preprotein translocase subunit SecG